MPRTNKAQMQAGVTELIEKRRAEAIAEYEFVYFEETAIAIPMVAEADELVPSKAHKHDAAYDLHSRIRFQLLPGETNSIPTGVKLAIPEGHVGLICPRSGLAATLQITVANAPGVIDSGFRGEVCVLLLNEGSSRVWVHEGDRIAQLLLMKLPLSYLQRVDNLPPAVDERGMGGFGSTGR